MICSFLLTKSVGNDSEHLAAPIPATKIAPAHVVAYVAPAGASPIAGKDMGTVYDAIHQCHGEAGLRCMMACSNS